MFYVSSYLYPIFRFNAINVSFDVLDILGTTMTVSLIFLKVVKFFFFFEFNM